MVALDAVIRAFGRPLDTRVQIDEIRAALNQLYTKGASWGEQDAASEAAQEIRDMRHDMARHIEEGRW